LVAWRLIVGLGGFALLGTLALAFGEARMPTLVVLFVVWGVLALGGEVVGLIASLRRPPRWQAPDDAKEADGAIEFTALRGARSIPNSDDPRFGRFEGLGDAEETPPREVTSGRSENLPLLGTVTLATIFVGRYGNAWNDAEVAQTLASLQRAGVWIEREAQRWRAKVNVVLSETYISCDDEEPFTPTPMEVVSEGDHLGLFEGQAVERDMASVSRAVAALEFEGIADLALRLDRRLAGDRVVWLIFPKAAGRSHAIDAMATLLPGTAFAICYAAYADFPAPLNGPPVPSSTTLAHELMHLFGASDKYERSLDDFPTGSVTRRDIMRLDLSTLRQIRVDPLTAVEIGWSPDGELPGLDRFPTNTTTPATPRDGVPRASS